MSDFDVVDDGMTNRKLSDADIEALIDGAPVSGAPAPLTELLTSLRQRAAAVPSVAASGALKEFIGDATSAPAESEAPDLHPAVAARPSRSLLVKASAVLGLIPTYALVGAVAAAAAVGGAQMLGIVDVPFLPDRGDRVETPAPEPAPTASVATAPTDAPISSSAEAPDRSTVSERLSGHRPVAPAIPGSTDDDATVVGCPPATTLPHNPPPGQPPTQTSQPAQPCGPATSVPTTAVTPAPGSRPAAPTTAVTPAPGSRPAATTTPAPGVQPAVPMTPPTGPQPTQPEGLQPVAPTTQPTMPSTTQPTTGSDAVGDAAGATSPETHPPAFETATPNTSPTTLPESFGSGSTPGP